jgi:transcriptional regulator with XRE-family HTH domain
LGGSRFEGDGSDAVADGDGGFGAWLGGQLAERGWSQNALAARLEPAGAPGSKQSHVSKWLHGQRHPSRRSCVALATALGFPPAVVLARAGHRPRAGEDDGPSAAHIIALVRATPEDRLQHLIPLLERLLGPDADVPPLAEPATADAAD